MFIDRARIQVKAGDGGDGMSSFRREKFVPKGGPSGGDGGRGGDVVFIVDNNVNTLLDFRYKRKFVAKNGDNGQTKNCYGQKAEPLYIKVPPGTIIKDEESGEVLADLTEVGQETVIVRGGRGGRGNARFVSSINRSPTFSEIAEYHFTTLVPVLGVVSLGPEHSFVIADIPGLIEGAHEGVGLGHDFLRHVERTKIIVHVVDVSGIEGRDPIEDYQRINKELKLYNERLANRPQIVAANKMDLPEAQENYQRFKEFIESEGKEIFPISAATNEGLKELMIRVSKALDDYVEEPEAVAEVKVYEDSAEADFVIKRDEVGDFVVVSKSLEKLVAMTKFENDEALRRFQNIWRLKGVDEALKARGIKEGDTVHVGEMEFEFKE